MHQKKYEIRTKPEIHVLSLWPDTNAEKTVENISQWTTTLWLLELEMTQLNHDSTKVPTATGVLQAAVNLVCVCVCVISNCTKSRNGTGRHLSYICHCYLLKIDSCWNTDIRNKYVRALNYISQNHKVQNMALGGEEAAPFSKYHNPRRQREKLENITHRSALNKLAWVEKLQDGIGFTPASFFFSVHILDRLKELVPLWTHE